MYIWYIDYILQEGSLYIDCKYLQYHVEIACKVRHIWVTLEHVIPNHLLIKTVVPTFTKRKIGK